MVLPYKLRRLQYLAYLTVIFLLLTFSGFVFPKAGLDGRIPAREQTIDVIQYTLNVNILDFESQEISGVADLQIRAMVNNVTEVQLDLLSLKVDSVWVDDERISGFSHVGEKLTIPFYEAMEKDDTFLISVFYHGKPAKDPSWGGFYFKDGYAFNMGVGMKSDPPGFGRAWYPCVDNFTDRAGYDYFITVSDKHTAVCPGLLMEVIENDDGTHTFHWQLQHSIPTYLSSVAVSDYVCLSDTFHGQERDIPVMIFVAPEDSLNAAGSFRDLPKWMECFEDIYGPYQWEKIGFVSTPFSGGAMEHATAISFSRSTLMDTTTFKGILVHELSHSWFGNLVTCETADDMWLNEGWASYSVPLYLEWAKGKKEYRDYMMRNHKNVLRFAHIRDRGYRAVYGNSPDFTYGSTVYNKGADVAYNLRNYIGDDYFFPALKKYFKTYAFKSINTDDFKRFFAAQTETDLDPFFHFWVYGKGFPHFSIDSFKVNNEGNFRNVIVYSRQKLLGTNQYSNYNQIEILFFGKNWITQNKLMQMSGAVDSAVFNLDFDPETIIIDPENKIPGATTGEVIVIKEKGDRDLKNAYFSLHIKRVKDSALFKIDRDWVCPDTIGSEFKIDPAGYWTISGYNLSKQVLEGKFIYENLKFVSNEFIQAIKKQGKLDSLVLLYRSGTGEDWRSIEAKSDHTEGGGGFTTSFIKPGEYCIGLNNRE